MLKVLNNSAFQDGCVLLLGGFDGLHKGHAAILNEALKSNLPVGVTCFSGGKAGGDLFTFPEREFIFKNAGVAFLEERVFDEALLNTAPQEFLKELFSRYPVRAFYCGEDFRFGKGAAGDVALLKRAAPCPVHALPLVKREGKKISASELKESVKRGDVATLNALLSGGYFIENSVEHGREVGRELGFPTLNLSFGAGKIPLGEGVYAGVAQTAQGEYPAIINVGARPTFQVKESKIEAHLKGFEGNLYGAKVRLFPQKFLRPVQAFSCKEKLIEQLIKDRESI